MDMLKYEFFRFFKNNEESLYKIRVRKGSPDSVNFKYFKSALKNDILEDFEKKEIKEGITKGYLAEAKISLEGTHRNVIVWLNQEMLSPGIMGHIQLIIRRIKAWFRKTF